METPVEEQRLVGSLPADLVKDFRKLAIDRRISVKALMEEVIREYLGKGGEAKKK